MPVCIVRQAAFETPPPLWYLLSLRHLIPFLPPLLPGEQHPARYIYTHIYMPTCIFNAEAAFDTAPPPPSGIFSVYDIPSPSFPLSSR